MTRPRPAPSAAELPRQQSRTRRFSLGLPRSFTVAPDGERAVFLRAMAGDDPSTGLWTLDLATGAERLLVDPSRLDVPEGVTPEEAARRERVRETASGVVAYATDRAVRLAAFAVGGCLWTADLVDGEVTRVPLPSPVADPRPDPTGRRVALVSGGQLSFLEVGTAGLVPLSPEPESPEVTWGLAEFVAAEEMGRGRGFWWAPDGEAVAVARVDTTDVQTWWIADPADPARRPTAVAYPAAGTPNADVRLWLVRLDGRDPVAVDWDRATFPYLAGVRWTDAGLLLTVQTRDQGTMRVLACDPETGATSTRREVHDSAWVELVPGSPTLLDDGRLATVEDDGAARRLFFDGVARTGDELQVRGIHGVLDDGILIAASRDPTTVALWRVGADDGHPVLLSPGDGVASGSGDGGVVVVAQRRLDSTDVVTTVRTPHAEHRVRSDAETPVLAPRVELLRLGERDLRAALVLPGWWTERDGGLPVLCDPYGGPHAQRVLAAGGAYTTSQWFAEHGFAVLVVDGRGTPGRGPAWEREVAGDLAGPVLADQVDGLAAAAKTHPALDPSRVGIRGWSFGGYLAALAVLRRPEVFHAAVAGAPVVDWRLYDTHYTERYLGDPNDDAGPYEASSLLADAATLERPLLLVHGLADDNVVAAHTLRLSRALLEAGRPHQVLPLSSVTHMTPQETVAENLLRLELDFLRAALDVEEPE